MSEAATLSPAAEPAACGRVRSGPLLAAGGVDVCLAVELRDRSAPNRIAHAE